MAATLYILIWIFALLQTNALKLCTDPSVTDVDECETACEGHPRCVEHGRPSKVGPDGTTKITHSCGRKTSILHRPTTKKECAPKDGMTNDQLSKYRNGDIPSCDRPPAGAAGANPPLICYFCKPFAQPSTDQQRPTVCADGRTAIRAGYGRGILGLQPATEKWKLVMPPGVGGELKICRLCLLDNAGALQLAARHIAVPAAAVDASLEPLRDELMQEVSFVRERHGTNQLPEGEVPDLTRRVNVDIEKHNMAVTRREGEAIDQRPFVNVIDIDIFGDIEGFLPLVERTDKSTIRGLRTAGTTLKFVREHRHYKVALENAKQLYIAHEEYYNMDELEYPDARDPEAMYQNGVVYVDDGYDGFTKVLWGGIVVLMVVICCCGVVLCGVAGVAFIYWMEKDQKVQKRNESFASDIERI